MVTGVFEVGSRICVVSYCPFRGLKGTVKQVHAITAPDDEEPFCFYYIELEASLIKEPVWFQNHEVEALSSFASLVHS
jgi:hypothetical protein